MVWQDLAWRWLAHSAAAGLIVLAVGSLAVALCREPVRRARLVVFTVLGSLLVPWIGMVPLVPRWSVAVPRNPPESAPRSPAMASMSGTSDRVPGQAPVAHNRPGARGIVRRAAAASRRVVAPNGPRLALAAYAVVTAGLLARWLLGQALLWRLHQGARPAPPALRAMFLAISGPAGERVRLRVSERIGLPFTFTWIHPVIIVPTSLGQGDDTNAIRYGLAHEWSHVEQHDAWAWNLACLAGCVLFYQPCFWWLQKQLRLAQDYLADDRAAACGSPEDYAALLVGLARSRSTASRLPALGISGRGSQLSRRIVMLVQDRKPLERGCPVPWSLGVLGAMVFALVIASGLRLDAAAPPDEPKPAAEKAAAIVPETTGGETLHYSGKVKDKDTGKPIAGATVIVRRSGYDSGSNDNRIIEESRHTTNADGVYSFTIPPDQVAQKRLYIELDVEHPDYATRAGFGYALAMIRKNETLGERPFFENVELRPAQPILGRIETPDGEPAQGVELLAYSNTDKFKPGEGPFEYGSFSKAVTDRDGRFRFPVVTPGPAVFWILPRPYAPEMHAVPDGKRGDFGRFVLQKGVTVAGRVYDAQGRPLAGLFVEIERLRGTGPDSEILNRLIVSDAIERKTETDAEGRFSFDPMPAGSFHVQPVEYQRVPGKGVIRRPLPAVFAPQKLTLTEAETPEPLEIRATPHVLIEGGWVDSQRKPRSGWALMINGRIDGQFWHTQGQVSGDGKFSVKVPHGLERAQIDIITNEHAAMRYRIGAEGKLHTNRQVMLGTLDRDVKDLEIIRYVAPVLLLKATTSDGRPVKDVVFAGEYLEEKEDSGIRFSLKNGISSNVHFEKQDDGRFRTSSLTPDRAVKITAHAEGFAPESRTFKLTEGKTEDATFVLQAK